MSFKIKTSALFFVSLFFLIFPLASRAIITDTIGIVPAHPDPYVKFSDAWYFYHLNLGETKRDSVKLINNSDQTAVVRLMAEDGLVTSDGSFALMPHDQPNRDMGLWIKLSATEVEIPPKSEKLVPFTITVPENADVGDHSAGIAMQEVEVVDDNVIPTTGIKVVTRIGVRMYETVPGEVKKSFGITQLNYQFAATGVSHFFKDLLDINKRTVFFIGIKNEGNVAISPLVTLDIRNIFGRTVGHLENQEVGVVFPNGENKDGTVIWNDMPLFGRYTAKVTVNSRLSGLEPKTQDIVIWVFPYKIGFVLIILVVFIILLRLIFKYILEASKERMPIYVVKKEDSLAKLAEKFSLNWKKIARINELKKPFEINTGEKLFIPLKRNNLEVVKQLLASSEMEPSIARRSGKSGINKKKKFALAVILVAIGGVAIYKYRTRTIHQLVQVPQKRQEEQPKQETADKTRSGALKKSGIKVAVAKSLGDPESDRRLFEKFVIMGYSVSYLEKASQNDYKTTTIEFAPESKIKADTVKNNLAIQDNVDMKEVAGLSADVVVYNFAPENAYFDFKPDEEPWWFRTL
jgi:hypothetical protein